MSVTNQKEILQKSQAERERLVKERDAISPNPSQRAAYIYSIVRAAQPKPTVWDIVCFCAEVLAVFAADHSFLMPLARAANGIVYTAHYNTPEPFESCLTVEAPLSTKPEILSNMELIDNELK